MLPWKVYIGFFILEFHSIDWDNHFHAGMLHKAIGAVIGTFIRAQKQKKIFELCSGTMKNHSFTLYHGCKNSMINSVCTEKVTSFIPMQQICNCQVCFHNPELSVSQFCQLLWLNLFQFNCGRTVMAQILTSYGA